MGGRYSQLMELSADVPQALLARFAADDIRNVDDRRAYQSGNLNFPVGR